MSTTDPFNEEDLDEEALRPVDLNLFDKIKAAPTVVKPDKITPPTSQISRPRGRPPGSTNRPKSDAPAPDKDEVNRRKADAKKRKADDYTKQILTELNDQVFGLIMSQGVPAAVFYKDGNPPATSPVNQNYTEAGNRIAIKPMQARIVASFVAEIEFSEQGSKVANAVTGGSLGLVIKGLAAGFMVFQYAQGLAKVYNELQPLLEMRRQAQERQSTAPTEDANQGGY